MTEPADQYHGKLRELHQDYAVKLPKKISQIIHVWNNLSRKPSVEDLTTLGRQSHDLTSSAPIFGFTAIAQIARQLNYCISLADDFPPFFNHDQLMLIDHLIGQLESAAEPLPLQQTSTAETLLLNPTNSDQSRVAIVKDNSNLSQKLEYDLQHYGYQIIILNSLPELLRLCLEQELNAIVLLEPDESELQQLQQFRQAQGLTTAVICVAESSDFNSRLLAVRAGAAAYFTKPADLFQLTESINELTSETDLRSYRVMIVDDDLCSSHHTATMLEMAGIETHVVTKPETILEQLEAFQPELILIDLYMPSCNGIELAAIIRQQPVYASTAIVFHSVETSISRHIEAIHAGGDDFLIKPMESSHLVADLMARVRRARTIRSSMMHDNLTGLLSHSLFHEQLGRELSRCQRNQTRFSYILIDMDHFKKINDLHGHGSGDHVLKSLAALLVRRLRHSDLIGRNSGEEFALILQDANSDTAYKIMDDIRFSFEKLHHNGKNGTFNASFSAGIATFPNCASLATLSSHAEKALALAKQSGRNQVQIYREEPGFSGFR